MTAGAVASSLLLDAQYSSQKPPGTAIVDTVGADDAFAAGLLDAIAEGLPAAAALRHANALGGLVACGQGAQQPWGPGEVTRLEEGLVVGAVSRRSMSDLMWQGNLADGDLGCSAGDEPAY